MPRIAEAAQRNTTRQQKTATPFAEVAWQMTLPRIPMAD
jgi:hypothetical protein